MVTLQGINSVIDRTLFTNRGPIVKPPLPLLTGSNLRILTETDVSIPTVGLTSADVGRTVSISGTPSGRNDGDFRIGQVLSSTTVRLEQASFDVSDAAAMTAAIVALANDLKLRYNLHRVQKVLLDLSPDPLPVHGTDDNVHVVVSPGATGLASAIVLLNDLRSALSSHVVDVSGTPPVHRLMDVPGIPDAPAAHDLPSAFMLANDLRAKYEAHRQRQDAHLEADTSNRTSVRPVKAVKGVFPGPLTGPFAWVLKDARAGMVADDPSDVAVRVNGSPAAVEAVFGLLGAVVLEHKPASADSVEVDYDHLENPPARLLRLNSPEFNLNQWGNNGLSGLPKHRYRARSFLIDPGASPDFMAPVQPKRVGWKYKGLERSSTAVLNDPTTLLLNVPTNRVSYPVLLRQVPEVTLRYDPTSLPQDSTDPWTLDGEGSFSLAPGGSSLTIVDSDVRTGPDSKPPFFHHAIDVGAPSSISAAFRALVEDDGTLVLDGVFTGVAFGVSDGLRAAVVGFLVTDASNVTSAISLANALKAGLNAHVVHPGSHSPDDMVDAVSVVDATDLQSLVILLNEVRSRFSAHVLKGGSGNVHVSSDPADSPSAPAASDLASALILANELRAKFNAHLVAPGVHVIGDLDNDVPLVKQAGILKGADEPEFASAWEAFAHDWSDYSTLRLAISSNGDAQLFKSGDVAPSASVGAQSLPALSDLDAKFDPVQQSFFGAVGRDSASTSKWQFVRVNIAPIDGTQIEGNKSVDYDGSILPELASPPWITVGHGGAERILLPSILLVDSTASTPSEDLPSYGMASGNFRGFLRLEPILDVNAAVLAEFRFSSDYFTSGLDNRSMSVVMDDGIQTVQLAFLQFSPAHATVTGTASEPFLIVAGDQLFLRSEEGPLITVTLLAGDVSAAQVVARINAAAGFQFADSMGGSVRLTSQGLGATSSFEVVSGSALSKLGLSPGPYFGVDSPPPPRVSWFGADFPDLDDPAWIRGGSQPASMLGRTMRISDVDPSGFLAFSISDLLVTNQAFNPVVDWKLDFRTRVLSYQPGAALPAPFPYSSLSFAGVLASVDEGPSGKNLEIHYAVDGSGAPFLNLLSFDSSTNSLKVVSQYAFSWDDGKPHTVNVYTSKSVNSVLVLGDGQALTPAFGPAPTYSGLQSGVVGPSVSFGSGSDPVSNLDARSARSIVDWESVTVFRDSKIGDPTSGQRRYVGIYLGGSPDLLSSYSLHQVDWQVPHTYRIVRDPVTAVSVYMDGGPIPVISVPYDVLSLPPASSSFLKAVAAGHSAIGFGSFNPEEMSRTRWDFFRYSVGRITATDRLIPPHQLLNQHNALSSPDHLVTKSPHSHAGLTIYSGGTPLDGFLADPSEACATELGGGTPPVPMTQDLESRGGLVKVAIPVDGIPAVDFVNTNGFLADLDDDLVNGISAPASSDGPTAVALANDLRTRFLSHLRQPRVHLADDKAHGSLPPQALDVPSAIPLANAIKLAFNLHRTTVLRESQRVHVLNDLANPVTSPDATNQPSLITLVNEIRVRYEAHRVQSGVHGSTVFIRLDPAPRVLYEGMEFFRFESGEDGLVYPFSDDETLHLDGFRFQRSASLTYEADSFPEDQALMDVLALANDLRAHYEAHRTEGGVHPSDDLVNVLTAPGATGLATALALLTDIKSKLNHHLVQAGVHVANDRRNPSFSSDPSNLPMAQALANELRLKFERHRINLGSHLILDQVNQVLTGDAPPVADAGWSRSDSGSGTPHASLQVVGPRSVLRYGTTGSGPSGTIYRRPTGIPDEASSNVELTVALRVNAFLNLPTVDTDIYAGFLSSAGPGIAVAIGFDVLDNVPYVKLQDVNADLPVFRTPFNWADGAFHTFRIVMDAETSSVSLVVIS